MSRPAMRHNVLYPHNYLYYYHANIMKGSFLLFNPSPITIRPYAHVTQKPHTWHIQAPVTHRPPRRPITQDQLRISPPPPPAIEEPHPPGRQLPSTLEPERNSSLLSRDTPGTKIIREKTRKYPTKGQNADARIRRLPGQKAHGPADVRRRRLRG